MTNVSIIWDQALFRFLGWVGQWDGCSDGRSANLQAKSMLPPIDAFVVVFWHL